MKVYYLVNLHHNLNTCISLLTFYKMRNLSLRMVTFLYRLETSQKQFHNCAFPFQISQSFPSYALSGHFQLMYGALASTKLSGGLATTFRHHIFAFYGKEFNFSEICWILFHGRDLRSRHRRLDGI